MKSIFLNSVLVLISVSVGLVLAELALRTFTNFPIHAPMGNRVFDDQLLYRMDSNLAGMDARGFRNPGAYSNDFPEIAAVGDSFTYGYNVSRDASWPGRLEQALGERVYNFGIGGYGLLQYIELVRLAVESGAKKVVVGILPENDMAICNAGRLTYWNDFFAVHPNDAEIFKSFCSFDPKLQKDTAKALMLDGEGSLPSDLGTWLSFYSAAMSAFRYVADSIVNRRDNLARNRFFEHRDLSRATSACADPEDDFVFPAFDQADFIPGFNRNEASYFNSFGNADRASRAVFRRSIEWMKRYADDDQVALYFFIIPSRKRVTAHFLATYEPQFVRPEWIVRLTDAEERLVEMMLEELHSLKLPVVDALPKSVSSYARSVRKGTPHYPCFDGHPLEEGYQALTDTIMELLQERSGNLTPIGRQ